MCGGGMWPGRLLLCNRVIGHTGKISWKFYFKNYFQSSRLMLICNWYNASTEDHTKNTFTAVIVVMLICNCQTTKRNTRNRRLSTIQKCCSFSEPKPSHNWEIVFEIKFPDIRFAGMPDYSNTAILVPYPLQGIEPGTP